MLYILNTFGFEESLPQMKNLMVWVIMFSTWLLVIFISVASMMKNIFHRVFSTRKFADNRAVLQDGLESL